MLKIYGIKRENLWFWMGMLIVDPHLKVWLKNCHVEF